MWLLRWADRLCLRFPQFYRYCSVCRFHPVSKLFKSHSEDHRKMFSWAGCLPIGLLLPDDGIFVNVKTCIQHRQWRFQGLLQFTPNLRFVHGSDGENIRRYFKHLHNREGICLILLLPNIDFLLPNRYKVGVYSRPQANASGWSRKNKRKIFWICNFRNICGQIQGNDRNREEG